VADGLFLGPGNPIKVRGDRPADAGHGGEHPPSLRLRRTDLGREEREGRGRLELFSLGLVRRPGAPYRAAPIANRTSNPRHRTFHQYATADRDTGRSRSRPTT
jgi:hypothetical protein